LIRSHLGASGSAPLAVWTRSFIPASSSQAQGDIWDFIGISLGNLMFWKKTFFEEPDYELKFVLRLFFGLATLLSMISSG